MYRHLELVERSTIISSNMKSYYIYFMASKNKGALYIGIAGDLLRRVDEHKAHVVDGFTKQYNCVNLVYFEEISGPNDAISREKQLKKWSRAKKEYLINEVNPSWDDLSDKWY